MVKWPYERAVLCNCTSAATDISLFNQFSETFYMYNIAKSIIINGVDFILLTQVQKGTEHGNNFI